MNKYFARCLVLTMAASFTWLLLASSACARTGRPQVLARTRILSAEEMQRIVGASMIQIGGDPTGGGGSSYVDVGAAPGPSYAWEGTVGDVKTDTGNKMTSIPLVGWTARGGLPVGVSLIHNNLASASRYMQDGPKWALNYNSWITTPDTGNTITVSWADGRTYSFFYNGSSTYTPVTGIYDTLTKISAYEFDLITKSQITYRFVAYGGTWYLNSFSDENGNTITINRNATTAVISSIVDPNNRTIQLAYDGSGRLQTVTDPLNRQWGVAYDGNGDLARIDYPALSGTVSSRNIGYSNHNITVLNNIGNTHQSLFGYNTDNTIAWERTSLGSQTSYYYGVDMNGTAANATTISTPDGYKTTHYYDTMGHLTKVTDPRGYSQNFSNYDSNNNAQWVQEKRGNLWKYTFDAKGNILTTLAPMTPENSLGNKTVVTYNSHNKPLTITAPGGESSAMTYDGADNLTKVDNKNVSNAIIATTTYTVSASTFGLVTDRYDANNHHTHYAYTDGYGNLTAMTTPLGHQTSWIYNIEGVTTSRTSPGLNPGSPSTITANYGLDNWLRTVSVTYSYPLYTNSDGNKTFAYNLDSNLTDFTNGAGHYTRTYDADERLTEEDRDSVLQVRHAYDGTGQQGLLSSTTDADGVVTSFSYDHCDELTQSSQSGIATVYQYDAAGNATVINDRWGNVATKTWDAAGRIAVIDNRDPLNEYLSGYSYQYNKDSKMVSSYEYGGLSASQTASVAWGYDPLGHLTSEVRTGNSARNASYVVDGVGNRTSQNVNSVPTTFTYDSDDEMTGDSQSDIYQYDTGGSITGRRWGGNWIYPYSTNDGQIAVIYTGASLPAYTYGYDALGRRAFRTASPSGGVNANDAVRTDYQYDGAQVLTEKQNGTTVNRYQRGAGGELLARPGFGGGGETPQMDGRGNMRQSLNNYSALITGNFDYSAFGELIGGNGNSTSPYGWGAQSGYRQDNGNGQGDCGLVLMGARWYDPFMGRFTSRDSDIKQLPYVYCIGDPINNTDPSGHDTVLSFGLAFSFSIGLGHYTYEIGVAADLNNGDFEVSSTPGRYNGFGLGYTAFAPYVGIGSGTLSDFNGPSSGYNASLGASGLAYNYNKGYKGITFSSGGFGLEGGAFMGIYKGAGMTRGGSITYSVGGTHNLRERF